MFSFQDPSELKERLSDMTVREMREFVGRGDLLHGGGGLMRRELASGRLLPLSRGGKEHYSIDLEAAEDPDMVWTGGNRQRNIFFSALLTAN